ncbi:MAG: ISL3 family transposase [Armatimonadota bacterium]
MKDTELYSKILGINDPWHVENVDIDMPHQTIKVYLAHDDKASWVCPECGNTAPIYDHREQREWRHLDSCQFKTYLVASLPRINCNKHGVHTVKTPWSEPNSRFTLMFEILAINILLAVKVQSTAAQMLRLSPNQIHDIMHRAVERGMIDRSDADTIKHLSIDEKSFHKGHKYITVLGDPANNRIIDVAESRTQEAVVNLLQNGLSEEQQQGVIAVSMDMWVAFMNARLKVLPNADTVHDRFHISKYLSDAVDKTRKSENQELLKQGDATLKNTKYIWLHSPDNMTTKQMSALESLSGLEIETSKVWMFKENFRHFFTCKDIPSAAEFFKNWYDAAISLGNKYLSKIADILYDHINGLLAYIKHRITNAYAESTNSMIQLLKANSRGFRRFESFRVAILFHFGKLNLYP